MTDLAQLREALQEGKGQKWLSIGINAAADADPVGHPLPEEVLRALHYGIKAVLVALDVQLDQLEVDRREAGALIIEPDEIARWKFCPICGRPNIDQPRVEGIERCSPGNCEAWIHEATFNHETRQWDALRDAKPEGETR